MTYPSKLIFVTAYIVIIYSQFCVRKINQEWLCQMHRKLVLSGFELLNRQKHDYFAELGLRSDFEKVESEGTWRLLLDKFNFEMVAKSREGLGRESKAMPLKSMTWSLSFSMPLFLSLFFIIMGGWWWWWWSCCKWCISFLGFWLWTKAWERRREEGFGLLYSVKRRRERPNGKTR